jgi:DNA-directed RNA polymerase specialized sigma24 family protein
MTLGGFWMPGRSRQNQERLPDFYLSCTANGWPIDPHVASALEELWPWFWRHVGQQLGDSGRAADLADELACRISMYLEAHPQGVRTLPGLCRVAATNLVISTKKKEGRIQYRGRSEDVEASLRPSAPDWQAEVEVAIWIDQVLSHQDREIRTMVQLRLLDETWDRIGSLLGLTFGQARLRFHRALRQIHDEVTRNSKRDRP